MLLKRQYFGHINKYKFSEFKYILTRFMIKYINHVSTSVATFSFEIELILSTLFKSLALNPLTIYLSLFELLLVWFSFAHWIPSSLSEDCWLFPSMLSWYSYNWKVIECDNILEIKGLTTLDLKTKKYPNFLTLGNIGRVDAFVSTRVIGALLYAVGSGFDIFRAL